MAVDVGTWVAEETGLPMLEASGSVVVRVNEPVRTTLGSDPTGEDLLRTTGRLLDISEADPALLSVVARARAAGSASGPVGEGGAWRVMIAASEPDGMQLIAAPMRLAHTAAVERRAAAADVSAGVSHEIANALSAIIGWAQLGRIQEPAEARETLALIEESAVAARSAARRLLDAVRSHAEQARSPQDLTVLMHDVERLLRPEALQRSIVLDCRIPAALHVQATSSGLFTIVWNLVRNAMDALEQGGHISISATAQGGTVRLVVADDGPGMGEDQRLRAFDPYFSTKPAGTGLGLSMVNQAVEELGGRIALETERGRGTRFVVELVQAEAPERSGRGPAADHRRRSGVHGRDAGRGSVLVVEDDDALREMMSTTLSLQQLQVRAAASAEQALAIEGPFDVALVDLTLEDARGDRLVAELRQKGCIAAAALVTGATEPPNLHPDGKPDLWLRKPFEPDDLLETVRLLRTFGGRGASGSNTGDPV